MKRLTLLRLVALRLAFWLSPAERKARAAELIIKELIMGFEGYAFGIERKK